MAYLYSSGTLGVAAAIGAVMLSSYFGGSLILSKEALSLRGAIGVAMLAFQGLWLRG